MELRILGPLEVRDGTGDVAGALHEAIASPRAAGCDDRRQR
jgi:hypothetical protein